MKRLTMCLLLVASAVGLAQSAGEIREVDGMSFEYRDGVWVDRDLGSDYRVENGFSAEYQGKTWQRWYSQGTPTLKKILELGPRVHFKYAGADREQHVFGVVQPVTVRAETAPTATTAAAPTKASAPTLLERAAAARADEASAATNAATILKRGTDDDDETSETKKGKQ